MSSLARYSVNFGFISQFGNTQMVYKALDQLVRKGYNQPSKSEIRQAFQSGRMTKAHTERLFKNWNVPEEIIEEFKNTHYIPWDLVVEKHHRWDFAKNNLDKMINLGVIKLFQEAFERKTLKNLFDDFLNRIPKDAVIKNKFGHNAKSLREFIGTNIIPNLKKFDSETDEAKVHFLDWIQDYNKVRPSLIIKKLAIPESYMEENIEWFTNDNIKLLRKDPGQQTSWNIDFVIRNRQHIDDEILFKEFPFSVTDLKKIDNIPWNILSMNPWCEVETYEKYYEKFHQDVLLQYLNNEYRAYNNDKITSVLTMILERSPRQIEGFINHCLKNKIRISFLNFIMDNIHVLDFSRFDYCGLVERSETFALRCLKEFSDRVATTAVLASVRKHRKMSLELAGYFDWDKLKANSRPRTEERNIINYVLRRMNKKATSRSIWDTR